MPDVSKLSYKELLAQAINLVVNFQDMLNELRTDNKALKFELDMTQKEVTYWKDRYDRENKRANE